MWDPWKIPGGTPDRTAENNLVETPGVPIRNSATTPEIILGETTIDIRILVKIPRKLLGKNAGFFMKEILQDPCEKLQVVEIQKSQEILT